jgi:hypothetical protein
MLQPKIPRRGLRYRVFGPAAAAILLAALGAGCDLFNTGSSTSPSASSTTETFAGSFAAQGFSVYTFTVVQTGTVSVTLVSLSPTPTTVVGLGIGTPNGTTACTLTSTNPTAVAGSTAQITVTENPGKYCVEIFDVGNLVGSATFSITIAHT